VGFFDSVGSFFSGAANVAGAVLRSPVGRLFPAGNVVGNILGGENVLTAVGREAETAAKFLPAGGALGGALAKLRELPAGGGFTGAGIGGVNYRGPFGSGAGGWGTNPLLPGVGSKDSLVMGRPSFAPSLPVPYQPRPAPSNLDFLGSIGSAVVDVGKAIIQPFKNVRENAARFPGGGSGAAVGDPSRYGGRPPVTLSTTRLRGPAPPIPTRIPLREPGGRMAGEMVQYDWTGRACIVHPGSRGPTAAQIACSASNNIGARVRPKEIKALASHFGLDVVANWFGLSVQEIALVWSKGHRRRRRGLSARDIHNAKRTLHVLAGFSKMLHAGRGVGRARARACGFCRSSPCRCRKRKSA